MQYCAVQYCAVQYCALQYCSVHTMLALSLLRPSQKTFLLEFSEIYSTYSITMTCFDRCPLQMVSLLLLNPTPPTDSWLETTFSFILPLVLKMLKKKKGKPFRGISSSPLLPPSPPPPPSSHPQLLCHQSCCHSSCV